MIWDGAPFAGAKLAAMLGDALLVYRRDDKPGIPFPDMLDLPGGGREGDETPAECALRELAEEFGVFVGVDRVHYHRAYYLADHATMSHFLAVNLTEEEVASVRFGDEGQDWALLPAADFIADDDAVPRLREWLGHYCAAEAVLRRLGTTPDTSVEL
ncbi:MAG: NUDIX domain-containing protein [Sphingomonas sp.]